MSMSHAQLHHTFLRSLGEPAAIALVRCAITASEVARSLVRHAAFAPKQARDVLPYVMRADFETRAAAIVAPGVHVETRLNERGTSAFVELTTGEIALTALKRSRPPSKLPDASYRSTRAQASQEELDLYGTRKPRAPVAANPIYGVFVYGGLGADLTLGHIYFPLPDKPLRVIPRLNLLAIHAGAAAAARAEAEKARPSEEAVDIVMGLKRRAAETDEGA